MNECSDNSSCHANALCFNTIGTFECSCEPGYVGNGITNCSGKKDKAECLCVTGVVAKNYSYRAE